MPSGLFHQSIFRRFKKSFRIERKGRWSFHMKPPKSLLLHGLGVFDCKRSGLQGYGQGSIRRPGQNGSLEIKLQNPQDIELKSNILISQNDAHKKVYD